MKIKIEVNGKEKEVEANAISVANFLVATEVKDPDQVIVQINEDMVERDDFAKTVIEDGDEIDILYSMGGGR